MFKARKQGDANFSFLFGGEGAALFEQRVKELRGRRGAGARAWGDCAVTVQCAVGGLELLQVPPKLIGRVSTLESGAAG